MDDETEQALQQAEEDLAAVVDQVLDEVVAEFARELDAATEIVAARFSVSGIGRMFRDRVPRVVRRLLGITETAAHRTADDVDAELPDTWNSLPERYDQDEPLPDAVQSYVTVTEHLLNAVGDRLAEAARRELAAGVDAGEDIDQLQARLREAFSREAANLGDAREQRIARTEAGRAWNTAVLGAARAVQGPGKPLVKQWLTRHDNRVRHAHEDVDGQLRLLEESFTVGGIPMTAPHDPTAPAGQVVNCRCVLKVHPEVRASALESVAPPSAGISDPRIEGPYVLVLDGDTCRVGRPIAAAAGVDHPNGYWVHAPDARPLQLDTAPAGKTPTSEEWQRMARAYWEDLTSSLGTPQPAPTITADADGSHLMGVMIGLMPTAADAARLTVEGGEAAEELHCTMFFLADDADTWSEEQRQALITNMQTAAANLGSPVKARATGAAHWNTDTGRGSWVYTMSDADDQPDAAPTLDAARQATAAAVEASGGPDMPRQHSPWTAHMCAEYTANGTPYQEMLAKAGPVTFDRFRVAFGDDHTDIPLGVQEETPMDENTATAAAAQEAPAVETTRMWSTPDGAALAFEDQETGDGRLFAAGALHWENGPWPLQFADEMGMGHEGAELAGAINEMGRDAPRITGSGPLYVNRPAGADVVQLLDEGAPLGVSVDLDDCSIEFVDRTLDPEDDDWRYASARIASLSAMRLQDGAYFITASTSPEWTADGGGMSRHRHDVQFITEPGGVIRADALRAAFDGRGVLTAGAGDTDNGDGVVVWKETAGDLLCRITSARVRGATLVSMPAFADARIVLDATTTAAAAPRPDLSAASDAHNQVIAFVTGSPVAVGARETAAALGISMQSARGHLSRAAKAGTLVRLAAGLYVGPCTMPEGDLSASASGNMDLPIHDDPDKKWDGSGAKSRILKWATADDGTVSADKLSQGFLYCDPDKDPATQSAYKLPFADVFDDKLQIVANGVYTVASVLQGGMGGVDLPEDDVSAIKKRVETLYGRLAKAYDDPDLCAPWDHKASGEPGEELLASAWQAMRQLPPMPAAWFSDPTTEGLKAGSKGVHYENGRVFGWVAQAGEPHAGIPGRKLTIESLGALDLSHFLRQEFPLDDGTVVRAGAFTMNVGHHRDGAECETSSCQFDDSRTVAGVVTVGMSADGLWFSGAGAPWLSDWDRTVFTACQPSYHMRQGSGGKWELRAVLTVPVPGHSSPLLAAAVERSNLALAASAAVADAHPDAASGDHPDAPGAASASSDGTAPDQGGDRPDAASGGLPDSSAVAAAVVAALLDDNAFLDGLNAALEARVIARSEQRDEIERLAALMDPNDTELAAAAVGGPTGGDL